MPVAVQRPAHRVRARRVHPDGLCFTTHAAPVTATIRQAARDSHQSRCVHDCGACPSSCCVRATDPRCFSSPRAAKGDGSRQGKTRGLPRKYPGWVTAMSGFLSRLAASYTYPTPLVLSLPFGPVAAIAATPPPLLQCTANLAVGWWCVGM